MLSSIFFRKKTSVVEPIDLQKIDRDELASSIAQHSHNKVEASQSEDEFQRRVEAAVKKALKDHEKGKFDQNALDEKVRPIILERAASAHASSSSCSIDPTLLLAQQVANAGSEEGKAKVVLEAAEGLNEHLPAAQKIKPAVITEVRNIVNRRIYRPQQIKIVKELASDVGKKVEQVSTEQKSSIIFTSLKTLGSVASTAKFGYFPELTWGSCMNVRNNLKYGVFASIASGVTCLGLAGATVYMNKELGAFIMNFIMGKSMFSSDIMTNISLSSLANATSSAYAKLLNSTIDLNYLSTIDDHGLGLGRLQGVKELKFALRGVMNTVAGIEFLAASTGIVDFATKITEVLESFRPFIVEAGQAYQMIASKVISLSIAAFAESVKANVNVVGEAVVDVAKGTVDVVDSALKTGAKTVKGVADAIGNSETVQAIANSEQVKAVTSAIKNAGNKAALVAESALTALVKNPKEAIFGFFGYGTNDKNALSAPSTYDQAQEVGMLSGELASALQAQQGIGMTSQAAIGYSFRGSKKKKSVRKSKSVSKKRKSARKSKSVSKKKKSVRKNKSVSKKRKSVSKKKK
jgi:hypothetical protein